MRYVLVDTENVGCKYALIASKLTKGDALFLFFTETNAGMNIPVELLSSITSKDVLFKALFCTKGHNALDFQLVSYLGYLIANASVEDSFVIFSKDHGFDAVVSFWKEKGVKIKRSAPGIKKETENAEKVTDEKVTEKVTDKGTQKETDKKDKSSNKTQKTKSSLSVDINKEFYLL